MFLSGIDLVRTNEPRLRKSDRCPDEVIYRPGVDSLSDESDDRESYLRSSKPVSKPLDPSPRKVN